ncbi:MAG TPA: hypothetical protein VJ208_04260 [Candidatus Nanoarchaeia archaeon]|nr:hypothetical protein [Candidatus Nanoarchaeia archaeon]
MSLLKKTALGGLALAILVGTFSPHRDDFPPIYTYKTGTGYGISLSIVSESEKDARLYGANLSFINAGNVNGANLSFINVGNVNGANLSAFNIGNVNGANLSAFNIGDKLNSKLNGLEVGLFNLELSVERKNVNGVQIGIANEQINGKVIQIGVYNSSTKNNDTRRSLLVNYDFR